MVNRKRRRPGIRAPALALMAAAAIIAAGGCSAGRDPAGPGQDVLRLGSVAVVVSGLPESASVIITLTGPSGTRSISATGTIAGLSPGSYTLTAPEVVVNGSVYRPDPASQMVAITGGATATTQRITYTLATGTLAITVVGLPTGTAAAIAIAGPNGYARLATDSITIAGLQPGSYTIEASRVQAAGFSYAVAVPHVTVDVAATSAPTAVAFAYTVSSGAVAVGITGLPAGVNGSIQVSGPQGYQSTVVASATLTDLEPGAYTLSASEVQNGSATYAPQPATQQITIQASTSPLVVTVTYVLAVGSLTVNITGLPGGVPAAVSVTGPDGYGAAPTTTTTLSGIPRGTYTVRAATVSQQGTSYSPNPVSQTVTVDLGGMTVVSVMYGASLPGALDLLVDGAYITQAVQTYANTVPLVADRAGLLRVFVRANQSSTVRPDVRVRFFNGTSLVSTITIAAPGAVPVSIDEGIMAASWNATLPASLLQPGLRMLIDVDPAGVIAESDEGDNSWPSSGIAAPLDIRVLPPYAVRFVPIVQTSTGTTGNVTAANAATFLSPMQKMHPVAAVDADVHAPYATSAPALQSGGTNWSTVLSEINALRVAEGSARTYYGVVRVGYTSGVAGLGYIGVPAAMGWDYQPTGASVMAHELGHTLGRYHAPCGNPAGVDQSYPYSGGVTGAYGYDIFTGALKPPTQFDLMSYCDPEWISDYNYAAILNYRQSHSSVTSARLQAAAGRSLLVWGRISGGSLVLEPAYEVDAPATLPSRPGPNRLEGFGPSGEVLFSLSFAGDPVADAPDSDEQTFAFAIPLGMLRGASLDRLRVSAPGRQAELRSTGIPGAPGELPTASRTSGGRVRVTWRTSATGGALIRNARTGEILSFGRAGSASVAPTSDELDVILSDGVRSTSTRLRPR